MITISKNTFRIDTPNTTYVFAVTETKQLMHVYYGKRIGECNDFDFVTEKQGSGQGTAIAIGEKQKYFQDNTCFEMGESGHGDYREPFVVVDNDSDTVTQFLFDSANVVNDFSFDGLPNSYDKEQTLAIKLVDNSKKLVLTLYYSTFADCDIIVRSASLTNEGEDNVSIRRLMSLQLDLNKDDFVLDTLDGAWSRERYINSNTLGNGVTTIDSKRGISSNTHNPYIVLKDKHTTFDYGICYGFNLVYSGNHAEILDKTPLGKVRVLNGINPFNFCWELKHGETFFTPEATMCFANNGTNELTQNYHNFVNNHIVRGYWKGKERPVLVNNWEATYFNFTEKKLLDIAKKAKQLGVELFVLDDGWFGDRTSDKKGLGDWVVNKSRLPNGIKGLADKINALGLMFGIWVEPEMVNPDSDLFRKHPSWAVTHPCYENCLCRNQLLLDLTNSEVVNYITEAMTSVFSQANISYVKWDFNRPMSEFYSPTLSGHEGEFCHRYMLGLYQVLDTLTKRFPNILFESCASGGNRFDLGMLCYMPQCWASDNTDSFDRVKIQEGTLTCYPQSTMGSHVSASPNHQTLRNSTIDNRFNTACIGAFGYELDLSVLSKNDTKAVKKQIEWYKKYRKTLQFGTYYRTRSVFDDNKASWVIVSKDKTQAVANLTNTIQQTIPNAETLKFAGLDENALYEFNNRQQPLNLKQFGSLVNTISPVHIDPDGKMMDVIAKMVPLGGEKEHYVLSGELLEKCGVALDQEWSSTGFGGDTRVMFDFGSRLYTLDKVEKHK